MLLARLAIRSASAAVSPFAVLARKKPQKVSPAAVVSATGTS